MSSHQPPVKLQELSDKLTTCQDRFDRYQICDNFINVIAESPSTLDTNTLNTIFNLVFRQIQGNISDIDGINDEDLLAEAANMGSFTVDNLKLLLRLLKLVPERMVEDNVVILECWSWLESMG